jgi:DNA-binding NtrC family response regulator
LDDLIENSAKSPTIILTLFSNKSRGRKTRENRVRQNHVEFLDVFKMATKSGYSLLDGELHVDSDLNGVLEALSIAEQKILQRVALRSPDIDDEMYLRFNLVGNSPNYVKAMRALKRIAKTESTVVIKGESGTGKEVAARAIHHFSTRKTGPFVPINCGAFSDDLLLSELFGYKKGAFTGAVEDRVGLLEYANRGTLFLDEVDSLSPRAQTALLRFLQDNEIRPIGSRTTKNTDVRIVAASNKNLKTLVTSGLFREDLLYRLDVLAVNLPALRQRGHDIALISQHILSRISQELGQPAKYLSLQLTEAIQTQRWPGNFREIESALLRAFLMSSGTLIEDVASLSSEPEIDDLPRKPPLGSFSREKNSLIRNFENEYLRKVLAETGGNVSKAAAIAKKERRAFTRLMAKHGIKRDSYIKAS